MYIKHIEDSVKFSFQLFSEIMKKPENAEYTQLLIKLFELFAAIPNDVFDKVGWKFMEILTGAKILSGLKKPFEYCFWSHGKSIKKKQTFLLYLWPFKTIHHLDF